MERGRLLVAGCMAVVALSAGAPAAFPAEPSSRPVRITVGRDTTYLLGPLNAEGTVNYVAAVNQMYGKGVTPESNAAALMVRALGPGALKEDIREKLLEAMGLSRLPEKGPYLIDPYEFAKARYPAKDGSEQSEIAHRLASIVVGLPKGPIRARDHPELVEWLKVNEGPLELAVKASKLRHFFVPFVSRDDPPNLTDGFNGLCVGELRMLPRALLCRALLRAGEGDGSGAGSDLIAVHRLARLVRQGPTLLDYLEALTIERLATVGEQALVKSSKLRAQHLRAHLEALGALRPIPLPVDTMDRGERLLGLDYVALIAREGLDKTLRRFEFEALAPRGEPKDDFTLPEVDLDFDWWLRSENAFVDQTVRCARKHSFAQRKQAFAELRPGSQKDDSDWLKKLATLSNLRRRIKSCIESVGTSDRRKLTQAIVQLLREMNAEVTSTAFELGDTVRMERNLMIVALALAIYRAEKSEYPAALDALVPKYVNTVPNDLFTEKPLRYRPSRSRYVLYSVGPNMTDDGGENDGKNKDDIAIKIE